MHKQIKAVCVAIVLMAQVCGTAAAGLDAKDYPSRPIRLIVPGSPGGGTDVLGRLLADAVGKQLKQTIVVENKPGASGMLGADVVLKAPADGYTLYMAFSATLTSNQWLYKDLSYNPERDFIPVAPFAQVPNVLLVHPSVPAHTVSELVALAKKEPGKLNYASSYPGSMSHLSMEMLKQATSADMVHVPYNGDAPSLTALVGGQVQVMITNTVNALPMIEAQRIRPLAVTGAQRAAVLPDVPTIAESGVPGYATTLWYGLAVARGTPPEIVDRLNKAVRYAQETPELIARLKTMGAETLSMTQAQFVELVRNDSKKLGAVIESVGITVN